MTTLRITEIFRSIQGESTKTGLPTTFIRLTGCPLRCWYCDTAYAFKGGEIKQLADIVKIATDFKIKDICITGGEPLAQPNVILLIKMLCDAGFLVSIETSGALSISELDKRCMIIMDIKTPASGEMEKNLYTNLDLLKPTDQLKFVICDRADYAWSVEILKKYNLINTAEVLFSTSFKQLSPTVLAEWIIADNLPVRFQLQLHKILWDDAPGH